RRFKFSNVRFSKPSIRVNLDPPVRSFESRHYRLLKSQRRWLLFRRIAPDYLTFLC
ncbi:hypothetical protein Bpfe_010347, partial [Biomphalaria pfeifferi]